MKLTTTLLLIYAFIMLLAVATDTVQTTIESTLIGVIFSGIILLNEIFKHGKEI